MEDQRLGPTFADPLTQAGPAVEISGDLGLFPIGPLSQATTLRLQMSITR